MPVNTAGRAVGVNEARRMQAVDMRKSVVLPLVETLSERKPPDEAQYYIHLAAATVLIGQR